MKSLKQLLKSLPSFYSVDTVTEKVLPKTIGLCLSGGGALGCAHIGVLQALEDCGIYPDVISGASMGAVIGSVYAAGKTPQEMLDLIKNGKLYRISSLMHFPVAFWKSSGLSNHQPLQKLIKENCMENNFETLQKPMYVCVSNLSEGKWEMIHSGDKLDEWVAASSSIPGVFTPVKIDDKIYVDGGLLNNMPAQPLKNKCDVIIGCDLFSPSVVRKGVKMRNIFVSSIRTMQAQNSQEGRALCDYLIEPKGVEKYHEFNFEAYQQLYQIGYSTATKFVIDNQDILRLRRKKDDAG